LNVHQAALRRASRIATLGVSEILTIGARATQRRREGHDVIVLGAGEPDFDTPDNIKDAAARAMAEGQTKYTALDGSPKLKQAIQRKFEHENGLHYDTDQIIVSNGAKQVLFNALLATIEAGDEVIIPTPYWTSYADIVRIAGGTPVFVPCRETDGFRLDAGRLEQAITPATRWILLNSPSNPSGAAYSAEQYRPILDVLLRHPQVWLLVDDMYEHILYDGRAFATPAQLEPLLYARTLTVNGVSKAHAMTGWRIGYGGGPRELVEAMAVVQSQATSCPSSIGQAAAIEALNGPQAHVKERCAIFQQRRDFVVAALNAIPGLACRTPEGAFYVYPSCAGVIGKTAPDQQRIASDSDYCAYLLHHANVAVVPGSAFGLAPYFRISYAASTENLTVALDRISRATRELV
jgi:aspartate aminotransferase